MYNDNAVIPISPYIVDKLPNVGSIVGSTVKNKQNHSTTWSKFVLKLFSKHQADMTQQFFESIVYQALKTKEMQKTRSEYRTNSQQEKTRVIIIDNFKKRPLTKDAM